MISRGCRWRPSDSSRGSRVAGKNEIHRRLQIDEFTEEPRLVFFNSCTNIISQLPSIPLDKKKSRRCGHESRRPLVRCVKIWYNVTSKILVYLIMTQWVDPGGMQIADATFGY